MIIDPEDPIISKLLDAEFKVKYDRNSNETLNFCNSSFRVVIEDGIFKGEEDPETDDRFFIADSKEVECISITQKTNEDGTEELLYAFKDRDKIFVVLTQKK
jgi:hypothetical protein